MVHAGGQGLVRRVLVPPDRLGERDGPGGDRGGPFRRPPHAGPTIHGDQRRRQEDPEQPRPRHPPERV